MRTRAFIVFNMFGKKEPSRHPVSETRTFKAILAHLDARTTQLEQERDDLLILAGNLERDRKNIEALLESRRTDSANATV